jgi:hypothetical protein
LFLQEDPGTKECSSLLKVLSMLRPLFGLTAAHRPREAFPWIGRFFVWKSGFWGKRVICPKDHGLLPLFFLDVFVENWYDKDSIDKNCSMRCCLCM